MRSQTILGQQAPGAGGPADIRGTDRPIYDTIDYLYDHDVEGDLAANDNVKSPDDFTTIEGEQRTETNEVMEVFKVELIPPYNDDGSLQQFDHLRLWDGSEAFPNIRFREFMLGFFGPDFTLSTPILGRPVLAGNNPNADPIGTATPKFGTDTAVTPRLNNDGSAITASFRVRLHVWRWQGTDEEMQDFFNDVFGRTSFPQNIGMSNPFTGDSENFERGTPIQIRPGAKGGSKGQFTRLTGGVEQELPKVYPWATWANNNNATKANTEYEFTTVNDRVDEDWKRLEFDFTDGKEAVILQHIQVNQPNHLLKAVMHIDERDEQPEFILGPAPSAHELPFLRPLDGTGRSAFAPGQLPVAMSGRLGNDQMIWNDGGGFRPVDDGTAIDAGNILVGVQGKRLTLES